MGWLFWVGWGCDWVIGVCVFCVFWWLYVFVGGWVLGVVGWGGVGVGWSGLCLM